MTIFWQGRKVLNMTNVSLMKHLLNFQQPMNHIDRASPARYWLTHWEIPTFQGKRHESQEVVQAVRASGERFQHISKVLSLDRSLNRFSTSLHTPLHVLSRDLCFPLERMLNAPYGPQESGKAFKDTLILSR
ncbi:hypothetical protein KOW79_011162 [Hemibagrus wyckioides]|uniref:Uncharacterized protein n=1 Tax=Hemibagrus wyckioides TaxID=337641 RepID=A0A9D3SHR2_9TELE|nr:hypothetical protein KOW79_011162 [Hemibagrus wyckioides]